MDENPYRPPDTEQCSNGPSAMLRSLRIWTFLAWIGAGVVATLLFGGIGVMCYRLWDMIAELRAI